MTEGIKQIRIRKARQADAVALFRLVEHMRAEMTLVQARFDEDRAMRWVVDTIATGHTYVADLSGRVVGTVALAPMYPPWSRDMVLTNVWLIVLPKFRQRGTGNALFQAAEAMADEIGAPLIVSAQANDDEPWKDEVASRQAGWVYGGGVFHRPAKAAA